MLAVLATPNAEAARRTSDLQSGCVVYVPDQWPARTVQWIGACPNGRVRFEVVRYTPCGIG